MSKGPGLFSDIGKKARDVLTKDYSPNQKFSVAIHSEGGVVLTSSTLNKGGLTTGGVAAKYKYKNTLLDVKVDTTPSMMTTITMDEVFPSSKAIVSFKFPGHDTHKVGLQYSNAHVTLTTAVGLKAAPAIDVSSTVGTSAFALGAESSYDTSSGTLTKYTVGVAVTKPDYSASLLLGDKGDVLTASFVRRADALKDTAVAAEVARRFSTNANTFTLGGTHAIDDSTVVKAKVDNHGRFGAVLQHRVFPKSLLTFSGEFGTKSLDQSPRFGVALALSP